MEGWKKVLFGFFLINLVVLNVFVGWLVWEKKTEKIEEEKEVVEKEVIEEASEDLTAEGVEMFLGFEKNELEEKIASLAARLLVIEESEKGAGGVEKVVEREPIPEARAKTEEISYIPVPNGDGVAGTEWVEMSGSGFVFDKANYSGYKKAYFEGNLRVLNGNGTGRIRLWDKTNSRAVDGSEISTDKGSWEWKESGQLTIWNGKNEYVVQGRSDTGYRVDGSGLRIRVFWEN